MLWNKGVSENLIRLWISYSLVQGGVGDSLRARGSTLPPHTHLSLRP